MRAPNTIRAKFGSLARRNQPGRGHFDFGPFGIDGYRYQLGDARGFCKLGEINARYTMAFAIGFPRATAELSLW